MRSSFIRVFIGLAFGMFPAALVAQHDDHAAAPAPSRPVIYWDRSPAVLRYQLGRLSNPQLLSLELTPPEPKFAPGYLAIMTRPGLSATNRLKAATALAGVRRTSVVAALLEAVRELKDEDAPVFNDLARLLTARPAADLSNESDALRQAAAGDSPDPVRVAALAALATSLEPEPVRALVRESDAGPRHLMRALPFVPEGGRRSAYFEEARRLLGAEADDEARDAAAAALGLMPGRATEAFEALAAMITEGRSVLAGAQALAMIPREQWPASGREQLTGRLLEFARSVPETERTSAAYLDLIQCGTDLASALSKDAASAIRRSFRGLGVQVVRLRALYEKMLFDQSLLIVEAGKPVELRLENPDAMPHNWLLLTPGPVEEVGQAAEKLGATLDGQGRAFVPDSPRILAATKLLNSGESERLRFSAPEAPGDYPYICSFPGHWLRMRGVLRVVPDLEAYLASAPAEPEAPVFHEWTVDELEPELPQLSSGGDPGRGREFFSSAGCAGCHRLGDAGVDYGPTLDGVFARWKDDARSVLREILEPATTIDPRYQAFTFEKADGDSFTGFLVAEEEGTLTVQIGPGEAGLQKISKRDLAGRAPHPGSLMPGGLLNTLNAGQILDLLAYIKAGAQP